MIWQGFGAWQNGDKHVTNDIEMWQNFRHMLETAQPRGFDGLYFVTILSRCDKFCHNSLIHQSKYHISYRNDIFVMTNFVQFLSPVCHISPMLWQILSNFCPQFVTSYMCSDKCCPIFVPSLSHLTHVMTNFVQFLSPVCHIFWIFIHFYA